LLEPALRGEVTVIDDPLLVWKGGDEFVDARDAASGMVAALFAERPETRVYSIGMGVLHSFDDFVHAARQAVPGLRVEVRVEPKGGLLGIPFRARPALGHQCGETRARLDAAIRPDRHHEELRGVHCRIRRTPLRRSA
jgi:UDP-glucose 4-epimerase